MIDREYNVCCITRKVRLRAFSIVIRTHCHTFRSTLNEIARAGNANNIAIHIDYIILFNVSAYD